MDTPSKTAPDMQNSTKAAVLLLLDEATKIYRRIYNTALWFLVLGLSVAAAGVVYFYLSNEAIFIDRAAYEEKINQLKADNDKANTDLVNFASFYRQDLSADTTAERVLNKCLSFNRRILKSYKALHEAVVTSANQKDAQQKLDYVYSKLAENEEKLNQYSFELYALEKGVVRTNSKDEKALTLVKQYIKVAATQVTPQKTAVDDKPGLVFSPKLVYGFLSRLGGLLFIELVAFYLLKQYRVNMNDFRHYYGVARQIRINLYLLDNAESIEDTVSRIDIISKLFNTPPEKPVTVDEAPIATGDIDAARKLLEAIKDLIKR